MSLTPHRTGVILMLLLVLSLLAVLLLSCGNCTQNQDKYYWVKLKDGSVHWYYRATMTDRGLKVWDNNCDTYNQGYYISPTAYESTNAQSY